MKLLYKQPSSPGCSVWSIVEQETKKKVFPGHGEESYDMVSSEHAMPTAVMNS